MSFQSDKKQVGRAGKPWLRHLLESVASAAAGSGPKQPCHICCADGGPMTFAGLWERWKTVMELPEEEREHLLRRPAPLSLRWKFFWHAFRSIFRDDDNERANFTCHAPA